MTKVSRGTHGASWSSLEIAYQNQIPPFGKAVDAVIDSTAVKLSQFFTFSTEINDVAIDS